jgi:hypothetical protein
MAEPPAPLNPSKLPGADLAPIKDASARPDLEAIEPSTRAAARPVARPNRTARPWDRYDAIGAAILLFLLALWMLHFLLPAPPPTNVP